MGIFRVFQLEWSKLIHGYNTIIIILIKTVTICDVTHIYYEKENANMGYLGWEGELKCKPHKSSLEHVHKS